MRWAACGQSVRVPSGSPAAYAAKAAGDSDHASRPCGYFRPVHLPEPVVNSGWPVVSIAVTYGLADLASRP
jgi:hypothetical protein